METTIYFVFTKKGKEQKRKEKKENYHEKKVTKGCKSHKNSFWKKILDNSALAF